MFSASREGGGMSTAVSGNGEMAEAEAVDLEAMEENPSIFLIFLDNSDFLSVCLARRKSSKSILQIR